MFLGRNIACTYSVDRVRAQRQETQYVIPPLFETNEFDLCLLYGNIVKSA